MDTFVATSRYDRSSKPEEKNYRFLSLQECKELKYHALAIGRDGRIANVKITSVKTWKTRPNVKIGWKFGLYEFGQELLTSDDDNKFFVVEA